jgi:hypothetical protein
MIRLLNNNLLNIKEQKHKKSFNKLLKNFKKPKEFILLRNRNIKRPRKATHLLLKFKSKHTKKNKQLKKK